MVPRPPTGGPLGWMEGEEAEDKMEEGAGEEPALLFIEPPMPFWPLSLYGCWGYWPLLNPEDM